MMGTKWLRMAMLVKIIMIGLSVPNLAFAQSDEGRSAKDLKNFTYKPGELQATQNTTVGTYLMYNREKYKDPGETRCQLPKADQSTINKCISERRYN